MSDITFVQGDTGPPITGQILKADGTARNLSTATVRFQMRKLDDYTYTVDAEAEVTNAAEGRVQYEWAANDLSVPGEYIGQWQCTFVDGVIITTQPPNTITVRRQ